MRPTRCCLKPQKNELRLRSAKRGAFEFNSFILQERCSKK